MCKIGIDLGGTNIAVGIVDYNILKKFLRWVSAYVFKRMKL